MPLDFVQSKVPKLRADDLDAGRVAGRPRAGMGAARPRRPLHVAGHARGSRRLLDARLRVRFVANIDNLGAVLDPRILGWFAREELPFLMEVAERTAGRSQGRAPGPAPRWRAWCCARPLRPATRTSTPSRTSAGTGTSTRTSSGSTCARSPRCCERSRRRARPADDREPQDRRSHGRHLARGDPARDGDGRGDRRVRGRVRDRVPRSRFAPVKTTNDLLVAALRRLRPDGRPRVELAPAREGSRRSSTSTRRLQARRGLRAALRRGPPSLIECERLVVKGDVSFGGGVSVRGSVTVNGPARIEDGDAGGLAGRGRVLQPLAPQLVASPTG